MLPLSIVLSGLENSCIDDFFSIVLAQFEKNLIDLQ